MNSRQRAAKGRKDYWVRVTSPEYRARQARQREWIAITRNLLIDYVRQYDRAQILNVFKNADSSEGMAVDWPMPGLATKRR